VTTFIAEDFAAIRARLEAIRAEERRPRPAEGPVREEAPHPARPADFYTWLTGGTLWSVGGPTIG
jgi:Tfp pilus assembly protein FimV